jgi:hypothetical protein
LGIVGGISLFGALFFALVVAATGQGVPSGVALSQLALGAAIGSIGCVGYYRWRGRPLHSPLLSSTRFEIPIVIPVPRPDAKLIEYDFVSASVCVGRRVDFDIGREHYAIVAHGISQRAKDGSLCADVRIAAGVSNTGGGSNTKTIVARRHLMPACLPEGRNANDCVFSIEFRRGRVQLFLMWVDGIEPSSRRISFTVYSSIEV